MHKRSRLLYVATAVAMVLSAAGTSGGALALSAPAQGDGPSQPSGYKGRGDFTQLEAEDVQSEDLKVTATYIVTLSEPPLSRYEGGTAGIPATAAYLTGGGKINLKSKAAQFYMRHLEDRQRDVISQTERSLGRGLKVSHSYRLATNGFAAKMTGAEAAQVRALKGVAAVRKAAILQLDTDAGPSWIGAPGLWDGTNTGGLPGTKGEGILAGILDTGINYDNPSFADVGGDGYNHTNPFGAGVYKGQCATVPAMCNDKLVGIYDMTGEDIFNDDDGHGSHTGSTVAGNVVYDAVISTPQGVFTAAMISGVAPHANIIAYRVCTGGCPGDAILAAIDQSIADGVDVINYSIGSDSAANPWTYDTSLAYLNARAAGIFVGNSAGNAGPNPATIGSASAPWMTNVAASRHNRSYTSRLTDMMGGDTAPPANIEGEALAGGLGMTDIVYAGAAPYNDALCANGTADGAFTGKIVVCDRGVVGRVQKGINVKSRGAAGMVLVEVNPAPVPAGIGSIVADPHVLPAVHTGYANGVTLKTWLATGSGHMASIEGAVHEINAAKADIVAGFSSRGPNRGALDIIAPGIAAPGVSIWAAYKDPEQFNMIGGTSMAGPHIAGAGALLKALLPAWDPTRIQSALQLTSKYTGLLKQDGATPADPFDVGSGRVDLNAAAMAGFVMDETVARFTAADPAAGGDPKKLNIPSAANSRCLVSCMWTRELTSVRGEAISYHITTMAHPSITLAVTPSSITIPANGKAVITITAGTDGATPDTWFFGRVIFDVATNSTASAASVPQASIPVAVQPVAAVLPSVVTIVTPRNTGSHAVEIATGPVSQFTAGVSGLVKAMKYTGSLNEDSANDSPFDDLTDGVRLVPLFVPPNTARLYGEMVSSAAPDIDLFLVRDANGDRAPQAGEVIASSAGGSWNESIDRANPTAGYYWFVIQNWSGSASPPDAYVFQMAIVPTANRGNLTVTAPGTIEPGVPYDISMNYTLPGAMAGDDFFGVATLGSSAGTPSDIGRINVNVRRRGDDVTKTASSAVAKVGDILTYTMTVRNSTDTPYSIQLTDTLPAGLSYVDGSVSANASFDAGLNAILFNGSIAGVVKGDYQVQDNLDVANLGDMAPFGGFFDLRGLGFAVTAFGDDVAGNFNTLGCDLNWWDNAGGSSTRIGFSSNGLFFPRGTQLNPGSSSSPFYDPIPTAGGTNSFVAANWDDLVAAPGGSIAQSGYVAASAGTCGTPAGRAFIVQVVNAYRYDDETTVFNYQLQHDSNFPDEYWVLFGQITNTAAITSGSSGIEDPTGTKGLQYVYDGGPAAKRLTSGRVMRFYRPLVPAPPVLITYQARVEAGAQHTIVNTADYTLDTPGTSLMQSSPAAVRRAEAPASLQIRPLWQPIVANGLDATVIESTVRDAMGMPVHQTGVLYTTGTYMAALRPENEVPPVGSSASGKAMLSLMPSEIPGFFDLKYYVEVSDIVSITAAHIHAGFAGQNGPVIHWMYAGGNTFGPGKPISGTIRISLDDVQLIETRGAYINVHTSAAPGGEIRGQITREQFNASLASANEIPVPGNVAWGNALFTYNPLTRLLTYRLDVGSDTVATAAHIHDGVAGVNGPVLHNLMGPGKELKPGVSLLGEITLSALDEVKLFNGALYVNVHTADAPAGAMRGQINPTASPTGHDGIGWMPLASRQSGPMVVWAVTAPDLLAQTSLNYTVMTEENRWYVRPLYPPPSER